MVALLVLLSCHFVALGVRPAETLNLDFEQPRHVSPSWSPGSLLEHLKAGTSSDFLGPQGNPATTSAVPTIAVSDNEDNSTDVSETNAAGVDVGKIDGMNTWSGRRNEIWGIIKFWTLVLILVIGAYTLLNQLKKNGRSSPISAPLKKVALAFHDDPLRMQLIWASVAFSIADILAQTTPLYHEKNFYRKSCPVWDTRWTIAAVLNAVVFQLVVLQRIYDEMDRQLGTPTNLNAAMTKALKMLAVFIFAYTPPAILLNATLTGWVYRWLVDMTTNCVSSALRNTFSHLMNSFWVAAKLWKADMVLCAFFWPPSHLLNYILMQRWVPEFRPVWDGIVILSWNFFVLLGGSAREAVGATIFGPAPGPRELIVPAGNCTSWFR